jgi:hypothetical protein
MSDEAALSLRSVRCAMLTIAYRRTSPNRMQRYAPTVFSDPVTDIADLYLVPTIPADSDAMK